MGIKAGDTVMLHASVRAVGEVAGGPDAIHSRSIGADLGRHSDDVRKLPALLHEVGRGNLTMDQERAPEIGTPSLGVYSYLSDSIGSDFAALRAGT